MGKMKALHGGTFIIFGVHVRLPFSNILRARRQRRSLMRVERMAAANRETFEIQDYARRRDAAKRGIARQKSKI
jgi:hypothetical protein